ncbi:MAG: hypothetical protein GY854_27300 [Deltaproteobacteria bacterium]|nr:hypothetical protein [Deltaproteobacteria bacterium]
MSSQEGKFASKHPVGSHLDDAVAHEIRIHLEDGKLSCAAAIRIAQDLDVPMADVGRNADLLEARIHKCLFGLFGYQDEDGEKIPVEPAEVVSEEMEQAIRERLEDNCLTCEAGWEIAQKMNVARGRIASICEALGIKITNCRIGAFR